MLDTATQPINKKKLSYILIVDDDEIITTMLEGILPKDKYNFKSVFTSGKALEELIDYHYDIMLLDGNLPGISGFELLKYCKKHHPLMEIVMISGEKQIDKVVGALKDGAFDFIEKPFSAQKVLEVLDKVVKHKKKNFQKVYGETQDLLKLEEKIVPGYKIVRTLGIGMSGVVSLLQKTIDKTKYKALKILKNDGIENLSENQKITRFIREANIMKHIRHKNIVQIFNSGIYQDKIPYILMEYVNGRTLTDYIRGDYKVSLKDKVEIIAKLASALFAIHQNGVLHRDLKPANIIVDKELEPKILDFGIARTVDSSLTMETERLGSPAYMAPESHTESSDKLTPASDIFSLGIISYELLTGEKPFWGDTVEDLRLSIINNKPKAPRKINPEITSEIEEILGYMLNKNLKLRYNSADKIYADIKNKKVTTTIIKKFTSTFVRPIWK